MQSNASDFASVVEPLEALAGQRLKGPNRERCLEAYRESPRGFVAAVESIRARNEVKNPVALLVFAILKAGDHLLEPLPSSNGASKLPQGLVIAVCDNCAELEPEYRSEAHPEP